MSIDIENTKLNEQEIAKIKEALAIELVNDRFEIIPTYNNESRNWNIFLNGIFKNKKTKEYYQLRNYGADQGNGSWKKVRRVLEDENEKLICQAEYTLKSIVGGNICHFGRVEVEIEKSESDEKLIANIEFAETIENEYLKTSASFGIISAIEGMRLYQPPKGNLKIKVLSISFHEIDSSSITIAYAANMCVLRALDIEKNGSNTFRYVSGKFEIHKKYPIKNHLKIEK
jgi:hypothetical protein